MCRPPCRPACRWIRLASQASNTTEKNMTKQEKIDFVEKLAADIKARPNFYVVDMGGMTVEQSSNFRRRLFKAKLQVHMAKNTLIKKALDKVGGVNAEIYGALKQSSSLIFVNENNTEPAKVLKEFLATSERPVLKGAYIDSTTFLGEGKQLVDQLAALKSKNELIADIIAMLQAPMQNVLGGLENAKGTLGGLLKAIEEKNSNS